MGMKDAPIMIVGPIGSFQYQGEQINGMSLIDLIGQVNANLTPQTKQLTFHVNSIGGHDDTGIAMYNYIMSLKPKGIEVVMEQIGVVGSTATRIFLAGDRRIGLDDGSENWFIHNPWVPEASGDANALQLTADALRAKETAMREFYSQKTGITLEGLKPLMDAQTSFTAPKALELKFVTELVKQSKLAAYMKKEEKSKITSLLNDLAAYLNPKKKEPIVAIVIELENGVKANIPSIDEVSKLVDGLPVFAVDAEGNTTQEPLADGEYTTVDGMKFSVLQGAIKLQPAASPEEEDASITAAINDFIQVVKASHVNKEEITSMVKEAVASEMVAIKANIKSSFVPPKYKESDKAEDVALWESTWRSGEHLAMKKNDPEKYKRLYFAKYGVVPNI